MIVSIDFDGTWTEDPVAWRAFAKMLVRRGHTVIVTTNRDDIPGFSNEVYETVGTSAVKEVIFAGAKPKRQAARERGYKVDVWVDDMPEMVVFGQYHPKAAHCICRMWPGPRSPKNAHHRLCPMRAWGMVG